MKLECYLLAVSWPWLVSLSGFSRPRCLWCPRWGFPGYQLNCNWFFLSFFFWWVEALVDLSSCTVNTWPNWARDQHPCSLLHASTSLSDFTSTQLKCIFEILDWCASWIGNHPARWIARVVGLGWLGILRSIVCQMMTDQPDVHQEYPRIMNAEWYPHFLIDFPTSLQLVPTHKSDLRLVARSWKRWSVPTSTEGGLWSLKNHSDGECFYWLTICLVVQ